MAKSKSSPVRGLTLNAERNAKFMAWKLGTRVTKNDQFMMRTVFPGMNYSRVRESKSSTVIRADRVSPDGEHISVMVPYDRVRETPYGYALTLDAGHVQYPKNWQVSEQTLPNRGGVGINVSMSREYFRPKAVKRRNEGYMDDPAQTTWSEWRRAAEAQQRAGNTVRIRV